MFSITPSAVRLVIDVTDLDVYYSGLDVRLNLFFLNKAEGCSFPDVLRGRHQPINPLSDVFRYGTILLALEESLSANLWIGEIQTKFFSHPSNGYLDVIPKRVFIVSSASSRFIHVYIWFYFCFL